MLITSYQFIFFFFFFFFQAEDGIRDVAVTRVQTCALPISVHRRRVTVEADDVAAVDGHAEIQLRWIDAGPTFGKKQIGEDDAWALEFVDQVKELRDDLEAIGDRRRYDDDSRIVALAGAHHLPEIALFGFGGHARRRPCSLDVDANDGDLHHGRRA